MTLFGEEPSPGADLFEQAWAPYPRKDKKIDARKAWLQKVANVEMAKRIILDIQARAQNNWLGKEKCFIPLFGSYIRGERWNDEIYKNEVIVHESKSQSLIRRQKESGERVRDLLHGPTGDRVGPGDSAGTDVAVRRRPLGSE